MKSRIRYAALFVSTVLSANTFAGDVDIEVLIEEPRYELAAGDISFMLEAGASISRSMKPKVESDWDFSLQGYSHDLGRSSVLGAGIGYVIHPALLIEIGADRRNSFSYKKFQTSPGELGNKTRYFELKNTTVMANAFLNGSGFSPYLAYRTPSFIIDPFLSGGIGLSVNTITNFHSVAEGETLVFSMIVDNSVNSFAYQLGAGINVRTNCGLGIGVGYRYLDAGNFETANYLIDNPGTTLVSGIPTTTWQGDLKTNEVYVLLSYSLY